jgi:hypothetical protein
VLDGVFSRTADDPVAAVEARGHINETQPAPQWRADLLPDVAFVYRVYRSIVKNDVVVRVQQRANQPDCARSLDQAGVLRQPLRFPY